MTLLRIDSVSRFFCLPGLMSQPTERVSRGFDNRASLLLPHFCALLVCTTSDCSRVDRRSRACWKVAREERLGRQLIQILADSAAS